MAGASVVTSGQNHHEPCCSTADMCPNLDLASLPPDYWGLVPGLQVFKKLYIRDIIDAKDRPSLPGILFYKDHIIFKVDVVGVIVKVEEKQKCFIYAVDDGTGVIACCCFKHPYKGPDSIDAQQELNLPEELKAKLMEVTAHAEKMTEGFNLGDMIQVKGKLKTFRNMREIVASSQNNPMSEVMRMSELIRLYRDVYDRPPRLPLKVSEELADEQAGETTGVMSERKLLRIIKHNLEQYLKQLLNLKLISMRMLYREKMRLGADEKNSQMSDGLIHRGIQAAVQQLMEEGVLCQRLDRGPDVLEILQPSCELDSKVRKIFKEECLKPKYLENGCHYLHILDELHQTVQYAKLNRNGLLQCLNRLEAQSLVLSTTKQHYMIINT